jgi:hypothetical protein
VVVDDVHAAELVDPLVGGERVDDLGEGRAQAGRWRFGVGGHETRAGVVAAGPDQGDVVATGDQALDEPEEHRLDAAVALRGQLEPRRRDQADGQRRARRFVPR